MPETTRKPTKVHVREKKDFPGVAHYAIIEYSTISEAGWNPGETSSSPIVRYYAFTDREEWLAEIRRLAAPTGFSKTDFHAFEAGKPVSLRLEVVVED